MLGGELTVSYNDSIKVILRKAAYLYKLNNVKINVDSLYDLIASKNMSYRQALNLIDNTLIKLDLQIKL